MSRRIKADPADKGVTARPEHLGLIPRRFMVVGGVDSQDVL